MVVLLESYEHMKKRSQKEVKGFVQVYAAFKWQRQVSDPDSLAQKPRYPQKEQGERRFFLFLPIIF